MRICGTGKSRMSWSRRYGAILRAYVGPKGKHNHQNQNDLKDHRLDQKFGAFEVFIDINLFHWISFIAERTQANALARSMLKRNA